MGTEEKYQGPKSSETPPPAHEETLGALPGVPEHIARRYADTGKTPKSTDGGDGEEPTIAGHPLSFYDQFKTEEELTAVSGVGEARAKEILHERKMRDRRAGRK